MQNKSTIATNSFQIAFHKDRKYYLPSDSFVNMLVVRRPLLEGVEHIVGSNDRANRLGGQPEAARASHHVGDLSTLPH